MYRLYLKRPLDILIAGTGLIVLSPVLLLTALAIRLEDGVPALFRQRRVGRNGSLFTVLKFRSMPVNTGDMPSAPRPAGTAPALRIPRAEWRLGL
jgi:O-antigen biosynthesis protein WbqP